MSLIGEANDPHLGKQFELKLERPFLPITPLRAFFGSPVAVTEVMGISEAAAAAEGHHELFGWVGEVAEKDACGEVTHFSTARHLDDEILT